MNEIMGRRVHPQGADGLPTITDGPSSPLDEIELPFTVPLGSAELSIGELLALGPGSAVTLEGAADGPVPMVINGLPVASGKLVLVDGDFAIRIESVEAGAGQKLMQEQDHGTENTEDENQRPRATAAAAAGVESTEADNQPQPATASGASAGTEEETT